MINSKYLALCSILLHLFSTVSSVAFRPNLRETPPSEWQYILGPPNGTRGTIDFRYPDIIVDPPVDCPEEGVFPHPRNCSWYYRCYNHPDLFIEPLFHTAFFECEPGTAFSDALDQCIHRSSQDGCLDAVTPPPPSPPPCETICEEETLMCQDYDVCPPAYGGELKTILLCSESHLICTCVDSGIEVSKDADCPHFYAPLSGECFPPPDSQEMSCPVIPPEPCTCWDTMKECGSYEVCPEQRKRQGLISMGLCRIAYEDCFCPDPALAQTQADRTGIQKCEEGLWFNPGNSKCYPDPNSQEMSCPVICVSTCWNTMKGCNTYEVCPEQRKRQGLTSMTLCSSAVEECECSDPVVARTQAARTGIQICEEGLWFNPVDSMCYPDPSVEGVVCNEPTGGQTVVFEGDKVIDCNSNNSIPKHDWILKESCSNDLPICTEGGGYLKHVEQCKQYYTCIYDSANGKWSTPLMGCEPETSFNFETEKCEAYPNNVCATYLQSSL